MNGLSIGFTSFFFGEREHKVYSVNLFAEFSTTHWTMRFTTVLCVIVPEVALTVTADIPAGVDGTNTSLMLEHPATKPAERMTTPNRPRRRMERCQPSDRRRRKRRRAPKGRKSGTVILSTDVPWMVKGRTHALFFTVAIVRVVVAGAPAVTFNDAGENAQVAASGRPLQPSVTVPLKLFVGAALRTNVADDPALTVAPELDALKPKVAAPLAVGLLLIDASSPCFSPVSPAAK